MFRLVPTEETLERDLPLNRPIVMMMRFGWNLLGKIRAAIRYKDATYLPRQFARNPGPAEQRISRAINFIGALARVCAGDRYYLPQPHAPQFRIKPFPAFKNALRAEAGLPLNPPTTQLQRDLAHLRRMRITLATQPVSTIAKRLARRLGIKPDEDAWPTLLLTIHTTAPEYAAAHPQPPEPPEPPAPQPPAPLVPPAAELPGTKPPNRALDPPTHAGPDPLPHA